MSSAGEPPFIVDNASDGRIGHAYLRRWRGISSETAVATSPLPLDALFDLDGEWLKVDAIHILTGDEVSAGPRTAIVDYTPDDQGRADGVLEPSAASAKVADHLSGLRVGRIPIPRIRELVRRSEGEQTRNVDTHALPDKPRDDLELLGEEVLALFSRICMPRRILSCPPEGGFPIPSPRCGHQASVECVR